MKNCWTENEFIRRLCKMLKHSYICCSAHRNSRTNVVHTKMSEHLQLRPVFLIKINKRNSITESENCYNVKSER